MIRLRLNFVAIGSTASFSSLDYIYCAGFQQYTDAYCRGNFQKLSALLQKSENFRDCIDQDSGEGLHCFRMIQAILQSQDRFSIRSAHVAVFFCSRIRDKAVSLRSNMYFRGERQSCTVLCIEPKNVVQISSTSDTLCKTSRHILMHRAYVVELYSFGIKAARELLKRLNFKHFSRCTPVLVVSRLLLTLHPISYCVKLKLCKGHPRWYFGFSNKIR